MAKLTVDELKTELKTAGFTDEQLTSMTKPQLESLAAGYMRQSDYDRSMNEGKAELATAQASLQAANDRLNTEMAEWATMQRSGGEATAKMQRDLEKAQASVAAARARITNIATQAGLDPTAALADLDAAPAAPAGGQPPFDASKFVSTDSLDAEINRRLGSFANGMLDMAPELMQLSIEHQSLFGKPLDTREIVKELKSRASTRNNQKSLDPRQIWEEQHGVTAARTAAEEKRVTDLVAAAEAKGREAARSEMLIPGSTAAPGHRSVVFGEKGRDSAIKRPQPGQTVQTAASAFRTGKYRTDKVGAGKT